MMMNPEVGGLSYRDWAEMVPWQRDDFLLRLNAFYRKREQQRRKETNKGK